MVRAFFGDVNEWEEHTKTSWRALFLEDDNLDIWSVPGGKDPQPIAWDMRGHVAEFTYACEMTLSELKTGKFNHDGDSTLGKHVYNARRYPNRYGVSISKEAPKSPNKIDGAVAMIIARNARRLVLASKKYKERKEQEKLAATPGGGRRVWSFS
jgi:hypothetical protein